jgi:hypothetical protein
MQDELEQKLRLLEASITLFRDRRLPTQSLMGVLIDLYNWLENNEAEKRPAASKKKVEEKEGK